MIKTCMWYVTVLLPSSSLYGWKIISINRYCVILFLMVYNSFINKLFQIRTLARAAVFKQFVKSNTIDDPRAKIRGEYASSCTAQSFYFGYETQVRLLGEK